MNNFVVIHCGMQIAIADALTYISIWVKSMAPPAASTTSTVPPHSTALALKILTWCGTGGRMLPHWGSGPVIGIGWWWLDDGVLVGMIITPGGPCRLGSWSWLAVLIGELGISKFIPADGGIAILPRFSGESIAQKLATEEMLLLPALGRGPSGDSSLLAPLGPGLAAIVRPLCLLGRPPAASEGVDLDSTGLGIL